MESLLVPLSGLDQNGVETSSITLGYVLKRVDSDALYAAATRVVEKWRLLAGRLEWDNTLKTWCIRVPMGSQLPKEQEGFKFTTNASSVSLNVPIMPVDSDSAQVLVRPSLKFFRHSSTPSSLSSYSSNNAPIVSIHVSTLADCACVGITVPHGAFDAFGIGQIIRALDAELISKPWTPPAFSSINILRATLQELAEAAPLVEQMPQALSYVQREFVAVKPGSVASLLFGLGSEYFWHRAEVKAVYLGSNIVDTIVREAKEQVTKESGWISTGDILVAWFLKAAYLNEPDSQEMVSVTSTISLRTPLLVKNPAFVDYTHNAIMPCSFPLLRVDSLANTPISELALLHRKTIDDVRDLPFIQSYNKWVATVGGNAIPVRKSGTNSWIFSNQVIGHLDDIDFGPGSEMMAFWHWNAPIIPDHSVILNKFKGGYIIEAGIRRSRWAAMESEVDRIKSGAKRQVL